MGDFNLEIFIITLVVLILSISLHEFGHAISADYLGDPTPRRDGRVTLWPDKHFEIFGFIMILITTAFHYGIGWGKPVMVDSRFFKHPNRDMMIVAGCGPVMNLILALIFGLTLRILLATGVASQFGIQEVYYGGDPNTIYISFTSVIGQFLAAFTVVNLSLMCFNLIPIHPLDGGKLLSGLLPVQQAIRYDRFMGQWGPVILMIVVFTNSGILGTILRPVVRSLTMLIVGQPIAY